MHKLSALQIEECNKGAKKIFHSYMITENSNDARYGHLKDDLATAFTKKRNEYPTTEADAMCLLRLNERPIGKRKEKNRFKTNNQQDIDKTKRPPCQPQDDIALMKQLRKLDRQDNIYIEEAMRQEHT